MSGAKVGVHKQFPGQRTGVGYIHTFENLHWCAVKTKLRLKSEAVLSQKANKTSHQRIDVKNVPSFVAQLGKKECTSSASRLHLGWSNLTRLQKGMQGAHRRTLIVACKLGRSKLGDSSKLPRGAHFIHDL